MSGRGWLHHVALSGCLTLALLGCALDRSEAQTNAATPAAQPEQQKQAPSQSGPPPLPESPKAITAPEKEQANPRIYKSACGETESHDEADLCEQRRMSQAAIDAVWWASWQTAIGGAGFLAVVLSLFFTGWAAVAAGRAARAAENSVKIARRVGEAQVRAYVSIKSAKIYFGGDDASPFLEIVAVNTGQSPALGFVWGPNIRYLPDVPEEIAYDPGEEWPDQPGVDISPGAEIRQTYVPVDFTLVGTVSKHTEMPPHLGVSVTVEYDWVDVFGIRNTDIASFAGVAERRKAAENIKIHHPLNTSDWLCKSLWAIEKGKVWSGIAVRPPDPDKAKAKRKKSQKP